MGQPESNLRHPPAPPLDPDLEPPRGAYPLEKAGLPSRLDQEALRARAATIDARCPYCHDDIELLEEAWSCCALCLGRHHRECWSEHGACASCGNERSLSNVPRSSQTSVWRAPASFRERISSVGTALLIVIPLLIPVSVLVGKIQKQGGLVWDSDLAALDATGPVAESARQSYRNYLLARNSGYDTTARIALEQAERELAAAVQQLEAALSSHRNADGSLPKRFSNFSTVLERLRFYHGNTRRALDAKLRRERLEEARQRAEIPAEPPRVQEVAGG
jgi:hypothetical protein